MASDLLCVYSVFCFIAIQPIACKILKEQDNKGVKGPAYAGYFIILEIVFIFLSIFIVTFEIGKRIFDIEKI